MRLYPPPLVPAGFTPGHRPKVSLELELHDNGWRGSTCTWGQRRLYMSWLIPYYVFVTLLYLPHVSQKCHSFIRIGTLVEPASSSFTALHNGASVPFLCPLWLFPCPLCSQSSFFAFQEPLWSSSGHIAGQTEQEAVGNQRPLDPPWKHTAHAARRFPGSCFDR